MRKLTDNQELIIQYICRYDGDLPQAPEPDETHRAIVDQEDTLLMAKYLQVTIDELLGVIDEEFADSRPSVDSMDAADCFADILDFILDCGAKYKLK